MVDVQQRSPRLIRRIAPWLVFPGLMTAGLGAAMAGAAAGLDPFLAAVGVVLVAFPTVAALERWLPYRAEWSKNQGDVRTDTIHLIIAQIAMPQLLKPLFTVLAAGATAALAARFGTGLWPHELPILIQLALALLIAEFGRYWVHRAAHEIPWLWRLHAVHHSPRRLYWLNAGRFHPIEKVIFLIPETVPFILLGANPEVLALYAVFNSIHGLLQHSNIALRAGWLNYVFSLTELHRWHHSKLIAESNTNYGNNLIVWDLVFGTYFRPRDREVGPIGLIAQDYPETYAAQLAAPFASRDLSKPQGYESEPAEPA